MLYESLQNLFDSFYLTQQGLGFFKSVNVEGGGGGGGEGRVSVTVRKI